MRVLGSVRHRLRGAALRALDYFVTTPLVRWTWAGLAEDSFVAGLVEFRPSDNEAVRDMMAGRYLLAGSLLDTHGLSPFAVEAEDDFWEFELHGFAWLRHFRDLRDGAQRSFARTLVLDWIGREARYDAFIWDAGLTALRVLNWMRHLEVLLDGATPDQARTIQRSLGTQVQSLRLRQRFLTDPQDQLLAAIALVAATRSDRDEEPADVDRRLERLNVVLAEQIDRTGMHLSRSPEVQLDLLVELSSLRRSLAGDKSEPRLTLAAQLDRMHESLAALTLGTGEPGYFNGGGQLPHDTLIALQASAGVRQRRSGVVGGYAILRDGESVVIADSGLPPPPELGRDAHSGALAFEFSHQSELVIGNCGPAPAGVDVEADLFRQGVAHSAPTIESEDAYPIASRGLYRGQPRPDGPAPEIELSPRDHRAILTCAGYSRRFGVVLERRITLLSEGTTLVGQDRLIRDGDAAVSGELAIRFHLAPGALVRRGDSDSLVRLVLASGAVWTFLWEGAQLFEDDSLRHSTSRGFHHTRQLVLEAPVAADAEIAWILTREQ